jgi:hypothetical protein
VTAARTAGGQHLAATDCRLAGTEAVAPLADEIAGLERALHLKNLECDYSGSGAFGPPEVRAVRRAAMPSQGAYLVPARHFHMKRHTQLPIPFRMRKGTNSIAPDAVALKPRRSKLDTSATLHLLE